MGKLINCKCIICFLRKLENLLPRCCPSLPHLPSPPQPRQQNTTTGTDDMSVARSTSLTPTKPSSTPGSTFVSRHDRRRCRGKLFISDWKDPVTDRSVIVGDRWLQRWISHRWPLRRRGQGIVIGGGVVVVNRQVWEGMEQRPRGFASDPKGRRAKRDRWLRQRNWVVVERVANGVYWICFINTLQEGDFGWHSNSIWAQPFV